MPRADVFGKQFTSNVRSVGSAFGYNIQEVKAAAFANKPLNQRKANAARKATDQKMNKIAWFGSAVDNLLGMLSQPNVPAAVAPVGATTGFIPWVGASSKNAAEIIKDMNDSVTRIIDLTLGVEMPNTMIMPIAQERKIGTTNMGNGTDTTIKKYFMDNNPNILTIDWVNELKDVDPAPSGGSSPTNVMITYDRNPEVLTLELPSPYEQLPPEARNLEFVVNTHTRIGGVIVYYPLAIDILEGI